jgi:hypothetical protein
VAAERRVGVEPTGQAAVKARGLIHSSMDAQGEDKENPCFLRRMDELLRKANP